MTQTLDTPPQLEPMRSLGFGTFGNVASQYIPTIEEWEDIARRLAEPFDPSEVLFRKTNGNQVAAYVSAQTIYQRLDDVVGVGGWSKDFKPLVIEEVTLKWGEKDRQTNQWRDYSEREILQKGLRSQEVTKGLATITIHGVSKDGLGTLSNTDPSKGCESDAIKRAGMSWGIFRYICQLPKMYTNETGFALSPQEIERLRNTYLRTPSVGRTVQQVQDAGFQADEVRTAPRPQQQTQQRPPQPRPAPQNQPLPRYPNEQEEQRFKPSGDALIWPDGFNPAQPCCPACGGGMWDNRQKKQSGEFSAKGPDFTCKNNDCKNEKGFKTGVYGQEPKGPTGNIARSGTQRAVEDNQQLDQGYANAIADDVDGEWTDEFDDE